MSKKQEQEKDKWFELGKIEGMKEVAENLFMQAKELFYLNKDEQAVLVRNIGQDTKMEAEKRRIKFDVKYKEEGK